MNIACDLDGCVCDFEGFVMRYAALYGWPSNVDRNLYSLEARWPGYETELFHIQHDPRTYAALDPVVLANYALGRLAQAGHNVNFVTCRPGRPKVIDATKSWLKRWGIASARVFFRKDVAEKLAIMLVLNCELVIDDDPAMIVAARTVGLNTWTLAQPWNAIMDWPRGSWVEFLREIKK